MKIQIIKTNIILTEDGEFIVQAFTAKGRRPAADYHTDDQEDAIRTAKAMVAGVGHDKKTATAQARKNLHAIKNQINDLKRYADILMDDLNAEDIKSWGVAGSLKEQVLIPLEESAETLRELITNK